MRRKTRTTLASALLIGVCSVAGYEASWAGLELRNGDILVISSSYLVHIAAADSEQTIIGDFANAIIMPSGLDIAPGGQVFVTDLGVGPGDTPSIQRIDVGTGLFTVVREGAPLIAPRDVAALSDGSLIVADAGNTGTAGAVFAISAGGGVPTVIARAPAGETPFAVSRGSANEVFILNASTEVQSLRSIYRLNLATGDTSLVSRGGLLQDARFLHFADGSIYVAELMHLSPPGRIVRIDPTSGSQSVVASGGSINVPTSVALRSPGCLVVSENTGLAPGFGMVLCVDPGSGDQGIVSSSQYLASFQDIAAFRSGPTPVRAGSWGLLKATYR